MAVLDFLRQPAGSEGECTGSDVIVDTKPEDHPRTAVEKLGEEVLLFLWGSYMIPKGEC